MKSKVESLISRLRKDALELPDVAVQGILRVLESVEVQTMSCTEVFALLDQYVERELKDHEAALVMPLLREHFDVCQDCCEEYEALLEVVEKSAGDLQ